MMYYALAILVAVLTAFGHICIKTFALCADTSLRSRLRNPRLLTAVLLFSACVCIGIFVMAKIEFSVYYSFSALNYLFIAILSAWILREKVDREKIVGNVLIIVGVLLYVL